MGAAFKKLQGAERTQNMLQDNVNAQFQTLALKQLLNGHLIQNVDLIIGNNNIDHGLQSKLTGWFITDIDGVASIYKVSSNVRQITLNSSAIVTVSMWVF